METTTFRAGGTTIEIERLSPALIERVNAALMTRTYEGQPVPEETLRSLCSDCDVHGLIGGGYHATACTHRMGWLVYVVQAEGLPVTVRKPYEKAVAA